MEIEICRSCKGKGKITGMFPVYSDSVPKNKRKRVLELPCHNCLGGGVQIKEWVEQGKILKDRRIKAKLVLCKASKLLKIDTETLSMMERGVILPDLTLSYRKTKIKGAS